MCVCVCVFVACGTVYHLVAASVAVRESEFFFTLRFFSVTSERRSARIPGVM